MPSVENPANTVWGMGASQPVGSVADGSAQRLMVQSLVAGGNLGVQQAWGAAPFAQCFEKQFLNGASNDMRVNGTTASPVVFSVGSEAKSLTVYMIKIFLECPAFATNGTKLGGGTLLGLFNGAASNGILIGSNISGVQNTHKAIQYNEDLINMNGTHAMNSVGSNPYIQSTLLLSQPLAANSSDVLTITIRDALASMNATCFRAWAYGVRSA